MLATIARTGSMAAAARELDLVPSSLTYRVRGLEEALDVLLIDRSRRKARVTPAGIELLAQGERLLLEMGAVLARVKRVALGWEPNFTLAVDSILSRSAVFDLVARFYDSGAPTQLRLLSEVMQGGYEALANNRADLALGMAAPEKVGKLFVSQALGSMAFVFAVAPQHPLANAAEPLADAIIAEHRAVAVADSAAFQPSLSIGLLDGQDTLTVANMDSKIEAQLRGLGCGFLPLPLVQSHIDAKTLIAKTTERSPRVITIYATWRKPSIGKGGSAKTGMPNPEDATNIGLGKALAWWLHALSSPKAQAALLGYANK